MLAQSGRRVEEPGTYAAWMTNETNLRDVTLWAIYADLLDAVCKAFLFGLIGFGAVAGFAVVLGLGPAVLSLSVLGGLVGFLWPLNSSARRARARAALAGTASP
jgi:hypothetical protein